jgi:superfamily II DNA or RNA helicase
MNQLNKETIRKSIADNSAIYFRGLSLFNNGAFYCTEFEPEKGHFLYEVDGRYGDYSISIALDNNKILTSCDCPYPGDGCKHTVAALLDLDIQLNRHEKPAPKKILPKAVETYMTAEEIKNQVLEDRKKRAKSEKMELFLGDMYKGEHIIETQKGKQYKITLHDPENGIGHCDCPDFYTNHLGTCKHLISINTQLKKKKNLKVKANKECFPFIDIYWDSVLNQPQLFIDSKFKINKKLKAILNKYFNDKGHYSKPELATLYKLVVQVYDNKQVKIQENVLKRLNEHLLDEAVKNSPQKISPVSKILKTKLYPYQEKGVEFGLYKKAVLIGDEMGLGKTLQAICLSILKKEVFGFQKILVVTLASLKEQWKREIEKFTAEKAILIAGNPVQRKKNYLNDDGFFKITNYEAVLRDVDIISEFDPDLIILDEAQRIKNFETKTADAVKSLPRKHAMVLTGTPLENKLEDVYSIVQFLDPYLLTPLWKFAADHFMLSQEKSGQIMGYRNLELLREKLKPIVIRRKKAEVLKELPKEIVNNYYIELTAKQYQIHHSYSQMLAPIVHKKILTPIDIRRMQELLLKMRQVCDSTYLIDRETNISPKLKELEGILDELVTQNGHKVVIFSEWVTMNYLIAKFLSKKEIAFVELSGKIPVKKRQLLIDEFTNNENCKVFLSSDAGGTGLNLQAADCVINFELPWNPAKLNQRIGRVSRIGQKSKSINVVNLISKYSIEERILAGIQMKTDLFEGVFENGADMVEFSKKKRDELLDQLKQMMDDDIPVGAATPAKEIPEDTPHFLNPEVLNPPTEIFEEDQETKSGMEEIQPESMPSEAEPNESSNLFANQLVEKVEEVLNNGLSFIGGLLEMATGQKLEHSENEEKMINIDKKSGEVTMKFKLPGL